MCAVIASDLSAEAQRAKAEAKQSIAPQGGLLRRLRSSQMTNKDETGKERDHEMDFGRRCDVGVDGRSRRGGRQGRADAELVRLWRACAVLLRQGEGYLCC